MRYFTALLLANASAVKMSWPSVARCAEGQRSDDLDACDHNSKNGEQLDGTRVSHNHLGFVTNL